MITTTDFGTLCDGRTVTLYTLKNDAIELSVTDYGSTLVYRGAVAGRSG